MRIFGRSFLHSLHLKRVSVLCLIVLAIFGVQIAYASVVQYAEAKETVQLPTVIAQTPTKANIPAQPGTQGGTTVAAKPKTVSSAKQQTAGVINRPAFQNCTPTVIPSLSAAASTADPGVHENRQTQTYDVFGYTTSDVNGQMNACGPNISGERFAASTTYSLNWSYDFAADINGNCRVVNPSVAINILIVYPEWHTSPYAESGLATRWQNFISNLKTHEEGHAQLDRAYALSIYNRLVNQPATSCSMIDSAVRAAVSTDISALNKANDNYDDQTHHGTTQGALL